MKTERRRVKRLATPTLAELEAQTLRAIATGTNMPLVANPTPADPTSARGVLDRFPWEHTDKLPVDKQT